MIIKSRQFNEIDNPSIGGKAANLLRLEQLGINVPRWIVLPSKILKSTGNNGEPEISAELLDTIKQEFTTETRYAVRSSAIDEDGAHFSFAGQFETVLNVPANELESAIRRVWRSAFSERVRAYRKSGELDMVEGIGVIIQEMINPEAAGVAFGADPATGNTRVKVISSVFGLGEGLVSGELNADNFYVENGTIRSQLTRKTEAIRYSINGSGVQKNVVEPSRQDEPSLKETHIHEISDLLGLLEEKLGSPQDIEFAVSNDRLFLLQTRPITTLKKPTEQQGEFIIWDNSNIVESYPGVTTPLTFSFIIKVYEAVYRQFCMLMGVSPKEVEENSQVFANMLGLIRGRVYYNLLSWYRGLALLPGYSLNAEFMEKMMGVKERFDLKESRKLSKVQAWMRLGLTIGKILRNLYTLPAQRKKFMHELDKTMEEYDRFDFEQMLPDEIMQKYLCFEQVLLKKWKAPLVNDFFAMIYFGTLEKLTAKWIKSSNPNLHNDLLCGSNDIISTEPVQRILDISVAITGNAASKKLFIENDAQKIWQSMQNSQAPEASALINDYLRKFGERCVGELKLETVSYAQQPENFIRIIKSYVEQGIVRRNPAGKVDSELRKNAEAVVRRSFRGRPLRKVIYSYILRVTRSMVTSRENLRYERTRAFGMVRKMFAALGSQFEQRRIIESKRDIFYLTKEEIFNYINGASVSTALKELIAMRKEEFAGYENMPPPPDRIATYGAVYENNLDQAADLKPVEGDLKGIGCCPGRVRAKIRVVHDPHEIQTLNGDILVTSSTDPGWVTLFPTASAILVERGSLLSHSAIVSRELGIPCIVGITGLLSTLKTGDEVEMDGGTGEIRII